MSVSRAGRAQWGKVSEDRNILIVNGDRETGRAQQGKGCTVALSSGERGKRLQLRATLGHFLGVY